jgi:hypothetical protein
MAAPARPTPRNPSAGRREVTGMEKIVIRKLDKVETTSQSNPSGN